MKEIFDVAHAISSDPASFQAAWSEGGGSVGLPRVARAGIACYAEALKLPYAQVCGILLTAQLARMTAEEELLGNAENVFLLHEGNGRICEGDELFAALVGRNARAIVAAMRAVPRVEAGETLRVETA